jgi:predicted alpha/beta-fold hydrolase
MNDYKAPAILFNGHLQTIYPSLFRKFDTSFYRRERIDTLDNDFLDLDWSKVGGKKLAIISHGLEGSSYRSYVVGMVKAVNSIGWDGLAWNFRSCSGEPNKLLQSYHNGSTSDLAFVVNHAGQSKQYTEIALIGS